MTKEEALNKVRQMSLPKETMEILEALAPELAESEDENLKNKSGYYKAGKFWKASTLWKAVKDKTPQKVPNRYIMQECTWNISTLQNFADEVKNVQEVELAYPIILDINGNILDGAHRVVKAYLEGKDIDIVYLGDDEWPEPDYDEEKVVKESEDERIRKWLYELIDRMSYDNLTEKERTKNEEWRKKVLAWLEKQKEASKAIEAVDKIDKYIDEHLANAHDMKDSNPDKKYYRGWDDALGEMARILQDVYSDKKHKEHKKENLRDFIDNFPYSDKQKEQKPDLPAGFYVTLPDGKKYYTKEMRCNGMNVKVVEPKPAEWSEEDEKNLELVTDCVYEFYPDPVMKYKLKDWLKSLRPSWKPSEEKKKETLDGADIGYGLETAIDILENGFMHYQTDDGEYERKQALDVLIFLLNETRKKEDAKLWSKDIVESIVTWATEKLQLYSMKESTPYVEAVKNNAQKVLDWSKEQWPIYYGWKPSEEQIYSLGTVVKGSGDCAVGSVGHNLKSLYEDLKKL